MTDLRFNTVLKELPVFLTGKDNVEKQYKLKELTGSQRAVYNESFDLKIEMKDGKASATAGDNFKIMSAKEFLALCLYDDNDVLVDGKVIGDFPSTVTAKLHSAAMELSGLNEEALKAVKNGLGESDSSGSE